MRIPVQMGISSSASGFLSRVGTGSRSIFGSSSHLCQRMRRNPEGPCSAQPVSHPAAAELRFVRLIAYCWTIAVSFYIAQRTKAAPGCRRRVNWRRLWVAEEYRRVFGSNVWCDKRGVKNSPSVCNWCPGVYECFAVIKAGKCNVFAEHHMLCMQMYPGFILCQQVLDKAPQQWHSEGGAGGSSGTGNKL